MEKAFMWTLLVMVATSNGFFIKSRDIKKFFNFLPNPQEEYIDNNKHRPHIQGHAQRRPRPIPIQEVYYNDYEDYNERNDNYGSNQRNYDNQAHSSKSPPYRGYPVRKHPIKSHSHENCDDHDYDKLKRNGATKYENDENHDFDEPAKGGYYFYPNSKKTLAHNGKRVEINEKGHSRDEIFDYNRQPLNYKKDYVTGVLVAIPKIKKGHDVDDYFEKVKHKNPFSEDFGQDDDLTPVTTEANPFSFFDSFT